MLLIETDQPFTETELTHLWQIQHSSYTEEVNANVQNTHHSFAFFTIEMFCAGFWLKLGL